MGMNVGSNDDDDVLLDVNMTPLIDVMLVLIIMFIITIPIPNNAININLPNGAPPPQSNEKPPEIINLKLDAQGKIFWNGQPVENKQALENLFMTVSKKSEQDQIKLQPDRMTEYKQVAMVMAMAQRLNITKIGIESNASL
ncbi:MULTISPECIES: ExbD/TolR family protein [Acinetobacter]|jgi:biopolymer transport protein ExbD|uniref:Biopolymer transporter ExbD n=2 Tax=Acinetobacter tandoii TaxID=202954 RepID=R9B5J4_9GAMM|nr:MULTISPECIES: biopolymer transporter ExbD [Acinetobacter]AUX85158.1 biopolymer transporter ExbD [Acinetobacter sp. ACNIH2]EOR09555.1 biopolymer transporter ExbD [Acinetobacter tandoii DSM 14970 = CIP 107469]KAB1852107.1 biopolymer transporter ExbD [Acinetobacter tandoii]